MEFTGERYLPDSTDNRDELSIEHLHRYHSVLPLVKGKVVLDIACGEGYGSALIARYAKTVIGVDISYECIFHASAKYNSEKYPNLFFEKGEAEKIPVSDNTFDVVVSFETIEHISANAQEHFLNEVKRVLKEDGVFIISTPDKENYSDRYAYVNNFHLHELSREEFKKILSLYFKNTQILEQGFEIVSTISPPEYLNNENIRLVNWQEKAKPKKRKYLIAIASDKPVSGNQLSSLVLDTDKDYFKQIDRILELQNQVENLSKWGQDLDREKLQLETTIKTLNEQDLGAQLLREKNLNSEEQQGDRQIVHTRNGQLEAEMAELSEELKEKEQILQDLQFNFSLIKQQLSEVSNKLVTIYDSDGWKWLNRYYTLKGKFLNENSKHYKVIRKVVNFLRKRKDNTVISSGHDTTGKRINAALLNIKRDSEGKIIPRALPYFEKPEVSIIIPVYNAWGMNVLCITAIIENTTGIAYEVIIADDCSTDTTKDIATYFPNIIHIRNEKNLGFLLNCNNAASYAKGKYLHFLNNDTEVKPGWLSSLTMLMNKDETVGLTGSKLIYPDGRLQEAGGIMWDDASGWNYGHRQDPDLPEFNYVKEVDYISGASIMIRKSLWQKIGGFDERYAPAYFEDTDIAFEIRSLGFKVVYQPLSVVTHHEGLSHGTDTSSGTKQYQLLNQKKFIQKWKEVLGNQHFPNAEKVFWARDRSRNKKTILVIDHYVPQFDKDARSRTTYQLLQLFTEMNYNVKFISDNFYKHEPYTTSLQQMGIEVFYGPWYSDNWQKWVKENAKMIDSIYLNRPHISIKHIDFLKDNTKAKVIYYGHDLHYIRELRQYEIEKTPQLLESLKKWKEIESYLIQKSDSILTLSYDEKEIIENELSGLDVKIMPAFFYSDFKLPISDFSKRRDILFVGGFNHKPNVDAVLWFEREVWPRITARINNARFVIVGSLVTKEIVDLASATICVKGYVSDAELSELYDSVKMVVVPLRYGAGVKGKTVEAMYHGLPLVSTSFGIEGLLNIRDVLQPADDVAAFADKVVSLYNTEKELVALSEKEVNYAKTHFSTDSVKKLIADTF